MLKEGEARLSSSGEETHRELRSSLGYYLEKSRCGKCSECGVIHRLTSKGNLWSHGPLDRYGYRTCKGSGEPPSL